MSKFLSRDSCVYPKNQPSPFKLTSDEKQNFQQMAQRKGLSQHILWVKGTRDQMELAPWFLSADLFVYPGAIGLGLIHSFAYGLPVLTHDNQNHQMPEFEAMQNNVTGLTYREGSACDLSEKIQAFFERPRETRDWMAQKCIEIVKKEYSMNAMILNFINAIEHTHTPQTSQKASASH